MLPRRAERAKPRRSDLCLRLFAQKNETLRAAEFGTIKVSARRILSAQSACLAKKSPGGN